MILALATRHRVERPAISMEGGTVFFLWSGPARRRLSFAFDNSETLDSHFSGVRILSYTGKKCVSR